MPKKNYRKCGERKDIDLKEYAAKLPVGDSPEQKKLQKELFRNMDVSRNGSLSLSEIELGILQFIGEDIFMMKPAIKMAFKIARCSGGPDDADDLAVELNEFRTFLINVRVYIELWVAFDELDDNGDRRIEYDEFLAGLELIKKWGVQIDDPKKEFGIIDDNGGGYILFDEFCEWALAKNLDYDPTFGVDITDEEMARHLEEAKAAKAKKKRSPRTYKLKKKTLKELPKFLEVVYEKRDPDKTKEIPQILKDNKGKEVQFIKKLVAKYGVPQEDIPEELKKYTSKVRRKAQPAATVEGLLKSLNEMNARHQTVVMDLQTNNIFLEKKLVKQQKQLDKATKVIAEQQEEIDHMYRLVETFILANGGSVFSMYDQHPFASLPKGLSPGVSPRTPRGRPAGTPNTPRRFSSFSE